MEISVPDKGEITNDELNYSEIITAIEDGDIHIPEFQREFVWTEEDILSLLDSIYNNYPVGSLIFWVTNEDFTYSAPIGGNEGNSSLKYRFFVIDGQQRLKSLYHAAKSKELELKNGNKKKIDVVFDLDQERFLYRDNIRDRNRAMYSIPGVEENMLMRVLEGVRDSKIDEVQEDLGIVDNSLDKYLDSLEEINILSKLEEGGYRLTKDGKYVIEKEEHELVAENLVNNVKFVEEVMKIIDSDPGLTRHDAKVDFQEFYGASLDTAYHQFGKRCRWLRSLNLARKDGRGYYLTESGEEFLERVEEIEKEIEMRYIPLERLLVDQSELDLEYLSKFSENKRKKVNKIRKVFYNYEFSIILVNKENWDAVCDIFERINTEGLPLSVVDLMIAKTWSGQEFNLRDELEKFKDEIDEDVPDITVLQALSVNICKQCRRQDILGLNSEDVKNEWEDVVESIRKSIDFLYNNLNIPELALLPYPSQLVPLSRFFYIMENQEPNKEQKEKLVRWFWKSSISGRFDSAVASKLEEDCLSMENITENEPVEFQYSYIRRNVEDIKNQKYSLRNAFVKSVICLFASHNPVNPVNNATVSHDNFSSYKKTNMHHIFPKQHLRKQGVESDLIDSIANIMFLPANINNSEKFKDSPKEYLESLDNPDLEEALETHLIDNLDDSGLMKNDYNQFLNYRAKQILNKLEDVTGEENISGGDAALSPETPFTNEMKIREIIRSSDSYIYWFDKYFTRRGLEYLIQEIGEEDMDEIKILTGTKQTSHKLRRDFEKFKEELEEKGVNAEMRVISGEAAADIHDRWLISENQSYNIPSINTIGRGQYTEISESASKPPFEDWWGEGHDIMQDWNEVQKLIN